ncbi:hypothetical protein ACQ4LE_007140 [Meloidogyne hapla]|uniref:Uncharacterized protein n=1 Tax=Meloidogyne hapla TaxID=6305 RepID=A0A1I8BFA0_MELHA
MFFIHFFLLILVKDLIAAIIPYNEVSSTGYPETKSQVIVERLRRLINNSDDNSIFADPELPKLPQALENTNSDCLLWQYIQAKPLTLESVREEINGFCVVNNSTENNGWCEIELNVIIKQLGHNTIKSFRIEDEIIENFDFKFYIHFTKRGLWQVVGIPDCDNDDDNKKRVVRSIFKY